MTGPVDIDKLLGSLETGNAPDAVPSTSGPDLGMPAGPGMPGGAGMSGGALPEDPFAIPGMPLDLGQGMGIGAALQEGPPVSLEDTFKSNVQGQGPALGSTVNPLGNTGMEGFLEDSKPQSMGTTQTVTTTQDEIENPYSFPMDNAAQEPSGQIEESVQKTKFLVKYVAIGILAVIVLFSVVIGLRNKIKKDNQSKPQPSSSQEQQPMQQPVQPVQQPTQPSQSADTYKGPKIQTADPNALAVNETVYDDVMAITKQIQVENGSVECYLVGTPQYFPQKIKIPVTVEEYNKANAADIVPIQYRIVKISGQDYVIDPRVVYKEVVE